MPKRMREVNTEAILKKVYSANETRKTQKKEQLEIMLKRIVDFMKVSPLDPIPRDLFLGPFKSTVNGEIMESCYDYDLGFAPDAWILSRLYDMKIEVCKKHAVITIIDKEDVYVDGVCDNCMTNSHYEYVDEESDYDD